MTLLPFEWPAGFGPANQRLAAALRTAVLAGRLRPGDRLPPSRQLAQDLGLSRWVVTEAYEQLTAEGYLTARTGSGTVVAAGPVARSRPEPPDVPPRPALGAGPRHDLTPNLPDLRAFPRPLWRSAVKHALDGLGAAELGYPDLLGEPELRRVLADYLRRVRGVAADPADLVVTSGTARSMSLLFRALAASGRGRLAVEDPGWPRLASTATATGLAAVPIAVDADGVRADLLASAGAHAVCVTPAHQFPTGVVLAPRRRQVLLDWASEDRLVVEDDYDAEFRFDRRPVAALAGQARDRVAYLGSCSKTLVPGVRIGWMVLPRPVRDAVEQILRTDPAGPSVLDQRAFAVLVESGGYDRHLRRMRRSYRARRAELVRLLAEAAPTARVMGADAGVHLALDLGNADESSLVERLAADGLQVMALGECRLAAAGGAGILIGYANLSAHHLPRIAEIVASALR